MPLKSKLSTAALLAVVAASGLATTSANAGWIFVPENASSSVTTCGFLAARTLSRRKPVVGTSRPRTTVATREPRPFTRPPAISKKRP